DSLVHKTAIDLQGAARKQIRATAADRQAGDRVRAAGLLEQCGSARAVADVFARGRQLAAAAEAIRAAAAGVVAEVEVGIDDIVVPAGLRETPRARIAHVLGSAQ